MSKSKEDWRRLTAMSLLGAGVLASAPGWRREQDRRKILEAEAELEEAKRKLAALRGDESTEALADTETETIEIEDLIQILEALDRYSRGLHLVRMVEAKVVSKTTALKAIPALPSFTRDRTSRRILGL